MSSSEKIPALPAVPKKKSKASRLLLALLMLFFLCVLVILFFQSSLSKITRIEISGNVVSTQETIGQASGIAVGDHFFAANSDTIRKRIEAIKMIEKAEVTKHFPGLVTITVNEFPKVAFQILPDGSKEALLADGSTVKVDSTVALDKPILTGWDPNNPLKVQLCKVLGKIAPELLSSISEIRPEPSESYPDKIKMYIKSPFEVYTTISYLPEKIVSLDTYLTKLRGDGISSGILSLLEIDTHAPYGNEGGKSNSTTDTKKDSTKTPAKESAKDAGKEPAKETVKKP